jgi:hypothetical protein
MATRKSNSTAIGSAKDVGKPHRNPKAYKPATKTQQKAILAAASLLPGGVALKALRAAKTTRTASKGISSATAMKRAASESSARASQMASKQPKPKRPGRDAGKSSANMMAKSGVKSGQLPRGYTSASVSARQISVNKKRPLKNRPPLKKGVIVNKDWPWAGQNSLPKKAK